VGRADYTEWRGVLVALLDDRKAGSKRAGSTVRHARCASSRAPASRACPRSPPSRTGPWPRTQPPTVGIGAATHRERLHNAGTNSRRSPSRCRSDRKHATPAPFTPRRSSFGAARGIRCWVSSGTLRRLLRQRWRCEAAPARAPDRQCTVARALARKRVIQTSTSDLERDTSLTRYYHPKGASDHPIEILTQPTVGYGPDPSRTQP
jgi:hypothetical protein